MKKVNGFYIPERGDDPNDIVNWAETIDIALTKLVQAIGYDNNLLINLFDSNNNPNNMIALNQTPAPDWRGTTSSPITGNVYACVYGGDIWIQEKGIGNFKPMGGPSRNWRGMAGAFNGDVYACVYGGDIYKQTGGTGDFIALNQTTRNWHKMSASPNGDIYAVVYPSGQIYKQTNGTGDFISLDQTVRDWHSICSAYNGDVYACVYGGDIYKQTGGTGDFIALNQTTRNWRGMAALPNGDVYACVYQGDIYKQSNGEGDFIGLNQTFRGWQAMTGTPLGSVVCAIPEEDIYEMNTLTGLIHSDNKNLCIDIKKPVNNLRIRGGSLISEFGIKIENFLPDNSSFSGIIESGIAGASLSFGQIVAFVNSQWILANATISGSGHHKLGICVQTANNNGNTKILLYGTIRSDSNFPNLSIGEVVYLGSSNGSIQVSPPNGSGNIIRIIGYGHTAKELFFNPSNDYLELV